MGHFRLLNLMPDSHSDFTGVHRYARAIKARHSWVPSFNHPFVRKRDHPYTIKVFDKLAIIDSIPYLINSVTGYPSSNRFASP